MAEEVGFDFSLQQSTIWRGNRQFLTQVVDVDWKVEGDRILFWWPISFFFSHPFVVFLFFWLLGVCKQHTTGTSINFKVRFKILSMRRFIFALFTSLLSMNYREASKGGNSFASLTGNHFINFPFNYKASFKRFLASISCIFWWRGWILYILFSLFAETYKHIRKSE